MKLIDTLLLSAMVAILMIGIHQIFIHGFAQSYWIFMILLFLFFLYNFRKNKREEKDKKP